MKRKTAARRGTRKKPTPQQDDFGFHPDLVNTLHPIAQFLFEQYFRVDVEGLEHIPKQGPAMIIANHSGVLPYDAAMIHVAVHNAHQRRLRFLVDDFVFQIPWLGKLMNSVGGVRACPENAEQLLHAGNILAVFPEGLKGVGKPFEQRYHLQRLGRGGFVKLAMRTGVPIIPAAVIGAEEIHPLLWKSENLAKPLGLPYIPFTLTFPWLGPLGLVPLPTKWRIIFGKPIQFSHTQAKHANDENIVQRDTERVSSIIQQMIDAGLKKRTSLWY